MQRFRQLTSGVLAAALVFAMSLPAADPASGSNPQASAPTQVPPRPGVDGNLVVTVGMSITIDSPVGVQRVFLGNDIAEAIAIGPKEVLVTGKSPGQTTLIVWQQGGNRLVYDLLVRISPLRLEVARQQIARDFPTDDVNVTFDNETAFVRGTVKDIFASDRIMAIASTLGKAVNLLRVEVPQQEPQILLKVRFCNVDRSASSDLGMNLATSAFNQDTGISTGQYAPAGIDTTGAFSLSDALNILLFRKDLNLGVTIKALQSKNQLQMLAEPNVLAMNGKPASFLSGGEFPVPMIQGSGSLGTVTISFREFGIRLNFLPTITPRGTIRLQVAPEVSSLDFANAVTVNGTTVPAINKRRIDTEVELDDGQSFVIAGLIDNSTTETISKIPGLANIPLLGKIFTSRALTKNNSELLVIVTPEVVRPIPAGQALPALTYTKPFMTPNTPGPLQQPGIDKTGPEPPRAPLPPMPVEQLIEQTRRPGQPVLPLAGPPQMQIPGGPDQAPAPGTAQAPAQAPAGAVK